MQIVTLTKDNFETEVIKADKPVLVDFWSKWCGPCRILSGIVDEIANETENFIVGKVNVDEQPELVSLFGIMSIPTLCAFKSGLLAVKSVGLIPKNEIYKLMTDL